MAKLVDDMDRDVVTVATPLGRQLHSGLSLYTPVPDDLANMNSPALIVGTDFHQMLQISLAPGEKITAMPGTMVMMSGEMYPDVDIGDCGAGLRRCCCAGVNLFRLNFKNNTDKPQFLSLAPSKPGKIIPLPLERWQQITLTRGSFFAAYGSDWDFRLKLVNNLGTGCCGGQGFVLTELVGTGTAFISASGAVEVLTLGEGEKMVVDQLNLVGFEKGVNYDIRSVGNCLTCCCGGMGLFNAVLTGPGDVFVQSLPFEKLARNFMMAGGGGRGAGDGGRGRGSHTKKSRVQFSSGVGFSTTRRMKLSRNERNRHGVRKFR